MFIVLKIAAYTQYKTRLLLQCFRFQSDEQVSKRRSIHRETKQERLHCISKLSQRITRDDDTRRQRLQTYKTSIIAKTDFIIFKFEDFSNCKHVGSRNVAFVVLKCTALCSLLHRLNAHAAEVSSLNILIFFYIYQYK